MSTSKGDENESGHANKSASCEEPKLNNTTQNGDAMDEDKEIRTNPEEPVVWIRCDVYDTGIGIPGTLLSNLFFSCFLT